MDLLAGCRAFVSVSDAGSFTIGAAELRIAQSVASRRVAALEKDLGGALLDRSGRRATLTPLGRAMLPRARRLVDLSASLMQEAVRARATPFRLAVPGDWSISASAELAVAARRKEITLDVRSGNPSDRDEWVRVHDVDANIACVPADQARWRSRLGLATVAPPDSRAIRLDSLRVSRSSSSSRRRRLWLEPEDDVSTVRDDLFRLRDATGLAADQVAVAASVVAAVTEVFAADDALLCTERQAADLRLAWRPLADVVVERCYALRGPRGSDIARVSGSLADPVADVLAAQGALA